MREKCGVTPSASVFQSNPDRGRRLTFPDGPSITPGMKTEPANTAVTICRGIIITS
jgi:hypothetical protein